MAPAGSSVFVPVGAANAPRITVPAVAADNRMIAGVPWFRGQPPVVIEEVVAVDIRLPLPDIGQHIIQTNGVRPETACRRRINIAVMAMMNLRGPSVY
jgi:hypothetical protein